MPIVGSFAGASSRAYGLQASLIGDFESIATTTLTGEQLAIEFTGIPQTYTHLQIRALIRNKTNDDDMTRVEFNGDTASNYYSHYLYGDGSSAASGGSSNAFGLINREAGGAITAGIFSACVTDILDYSNTNKYKTVRSISAHDKNGSGNVWLMSFHWRSTAAITSIKIQPQTPVNYIAGTSIALYGIKG